MTQTSRISEIEQSAQDGMQAARDWTTDMIEEQPMATLCGAFAAGFVLGVGAVAVLCSAAPRSRSRFPQMNGLSQRIADAVSQAIPHQLSEMWQK